MKTVYKYIKFEHSNYIPDGKLAWRCYNKKHNSRLGLVCFDPPWKQYVFEPSGPRPAIFSADCLEDIADFLKQLNRAVHNGTQ